MHPKRLLCAAALLLAGCNSSPGTGRQNGVCVDSLDVVSSQGGDCGETYAAGIKWACATFLDAGTISAGACDSMNMLVVSFALTDKACFYDLDGGRLIGAMAGATTRSYCDNTTDTVYAGQYELLCASATPVNPCAQSHRTSAQDGGAQDGGARDGGAQP